MLANRPTPTVVSATLPATLPTVDPARLHVPPRIKALIRDGLEAGLHRYPSRSEAVFAVMRALIVAGYDDTTIASILLDPKNRISEKPRQQARVWVAGEIARARAKSEAVKGRLSCHVVEVHIG